MGIGVLVRPPLLIPPNFESYDALGWNLARGEGFTFADNGIVSPYFFRTPGYPLFLAAVYALVGHAPKAVYATHIVFHLLTVVLIFLLTRRCINEQVATLASLLAAVYPLTAMYIPTILPEVFSTFLLALSIWLFKRALDKNSPWLVFLTGAVMAYSALVRPVFALLSLLCFAGAWWANRRRQGLLRPFVVLHLGFLLVWFPWVARNYWLSGSFIPLSTEAPYQFWLGTVSVDKYATHHWKNPDYYFQHLVLKNRIPYLHDDPKRPSIIELSARNSDRITPIRLFYRTGESDPSKTVDMSRVGPGRFQATIPPQPFGTYVSYFVTMRHPVTGTGRLRYPAKTEWNFSFRIVPDVLHELGQMQVSDIHDIAAVGRLLVSLNGTLLKSGSNFGARENERYFISDIAGIIQEMSLSPAVKLTSVESGGPKMLRLHLSNGVDFPLPLQEGSVTLRRLIQRGGIDGKMKFAATVYKIGPEHPGAGWVREAQCGFELKTLNAIQKPVPCIQGIGFPAVDLEHRRNRAYLTLAWINVKRDFWKIVKASIFRIPRLWMVVGTTSDRQAYQVRGSSLLYPLLTLGTSATLVLGILGFVVLRKGWRDHWILAIPVVYISLVHAPFHAEGRYTVPGRPFYLIYTAVTLIYLWPKVRGLFRRRREDTGPQREPPAPL
jgi:hypothetical protein